MATSDEPLQTLIDTLACDVLKLKKSTARGGRNTTLITLTSSCEGEREGERQSARGVPPPSTRFEHSSLAAFRPVRRSTVLSKHHCGRNFGHQVTGGALCRPHKVPTVTDAIKRGPWRERPRDLAALAITPATTAEVAHATRSLSPQEPESANLSAQLSTAVCKRPRVSLTQTA
jgi:hypothetical protein